MTSGDRGIILLAVDRPCIYNVQHNEDIVVEVKVKDDVVVLKDWPARDEIVLTQPMPEPINLKIWAVNPDDLDDRRACGELVVPYSSLELYQEPAFQIWLGVLDLGTLAPDAYTSLSKAETLFEQSLALAQVGDHSKVNLTFTSIPSDVLGASPQEQANFHDCLHQRPVMRLLSHSNAIITELFSLAESTTREVAYSHREFSTKEAVYQGFVSTSRQKHIDMVTRFHMTKNAHIDRVETYFSYGTLDHAFKSWVIALPRNDRLAKFLMKKYFSYGTLDHAFKSWVIALPRNAAIDPKDGLENQLAELEKRFAEREAQLREMTAAREADAIQIADLEQRLIEQNKTIKAEYEKMIQEQHTIHGEEMERNLTRAEVRKEAAHEVANLMLLKWITTDDQALTKAVFHEWIRYTAIQCELERRCEAAKLAFMKTIEGETRGLLHLCFIHWVHHCALDKLHRRAVNMKEEMDDMLDMHSKRVEDMEKAHSEARASAHEAKVYGCDFAFLSWIKGNDLAALDQCFHVWQQYAGSIAAKKRQLQTAHVAILKALEGDNRADVQICFINWSHETKRSVQERGMQNRVDQAIAHWRDFVEEQKTRHGKEIERLMSAVERRKEQTHEVTRMMLMKWARGDLQGLAATIIYEWRRMLAISNELQRRHEVAKAAIMSWLEGRKAASAKLCFRHWVHFKEHEVLHRAHMTLKQDLDALRVDSNKKYDELLKSCRQAWSEQLSRVEHRKALAHEATHLMLRKWMLGDLKGLVVSVIAVWRRLAHHRTFTLQRAVACSIQLVHRSLTIRLVTAFAAWYKFSCAKSFADVLAQCRAKAFLVHCRSADAAERQVCSRALSTWRQEATRSKSEILNSQLAEVARKAAETESRMLLLKNHNSAMERYAIACMFTSNSLTDEIAGLPEWKKVSGALGKSDDILSQMESEVTVLETWVDHTQTKYSPRPSPTVNQRSFEERSGGLDDIFSRVQELRVLERGEPERSAPPFQGRVVNKIEESYPRELHTRGELARASVRSR